MLILSNTITTPIISKGNHPSGTSADSDSELKGKLKEIAAGLNEESNPVIMLMKYKKE